MVRSSLLAPPGAEPPLAVLTVGWNPKSSEGRFHSVSSHWTLISSHSYGLVQVRRRIPPLSHCTGGTMAPISAPDSPSSGNLALSTASLDEYISCPTNTCAGAAAFPKRSLSF